MYAYVIRRLMLGFLIIWGVYTITFFAVNLAPGDPFTAKESAKVTEADLDRLRRKWGYDRPVLERYVLHTRKMFWADAETSFGIQVDRGAVPITHRISSAPPGRTATVTSSPALTAIVPRIGRLGSLRS